MNEINRDRPNDSNGFLQEILFYAEFSRHLDSDLILGAPRPDEKSVTPMVKDDSIHPPEDVT